MAAAAAVAAVGGGEEEERQRGDYVMALPVALPLAVTVSQMDAGVPRKARTSRPRAVPTGWWAFRLPLPQLKQAKNPPRPKRPRVWQRAPSPGKKARRCLQCGSEVTPQWRSGAMGRSTLCNACGVRLKAAGALRDTEYRPTPATATATATKAAEPPPPPPPLENPALDSSPDSAICACLPGEVYLVKKQPKRERRIPKKEATPVPAPAPAAPSSPAIFLVRKKKPAKKPYKARNSGQKCLHCGTTSTPQWREGPMGRHTLCNACGVRYRQGRLLPEYRPAASPTFVESKHASRHREVLQLHRQQQNKNQPKPVVDEEMLIPNQRVVDSADATVLSNGEVTTDNNVFLLRRQRPDKVEYPPTPLHRPLPQPVVDDDPRVAGSNNNNSTAAGAVSGSGGVDELLDGPSAPPIVDGDAFFVD